MKAPLPLQRKAGSLEASLCLLGVFQAILEGAVHVRSWFMRREDNREQTSKRFYLRRARSWPVRIITDSCPFVLFLAHDDLAPLCEVL